MEGDTAPTFTFDTNLGSIRNITLRQASENNYCVWIKQGRLELEGCHISSQGLACVAVSGGADPRVRLNEIFNGKRGEYLSTMPGVAFSKTMKFFAILSPDRDQSSGNPLFRHNRIHDCDQSGVYVWKEGRGTFEHNEIFGNKLAGVQVVEHGAPNFRRNRIYNGKRAGIFIYDGGSGIFEDNDIFGNAHSGVAVRTQGEPTIRRNRIYRNGHHAIAVFGAGAGTFEENDLRDNTRGPWYITTDSAPYVKR